MKKEKIWWILIPCIFSFVTTIVLGTLLLLPVFRYSNQLNQFKFEWVGDGYAVAEYYGESTSISIPSKYNGKKVVEIANRAFSDKEKFASVKSITLPTGLVRIGDYAFCGLVGIESVSIPASCKTIGDCAFYDCESLKNVQFGAVSSVENIGVGAFSLTMLQTEFFESEDHYLIVDGIALFSSASSGDVVLPKEIKVLSHDAGSLLGKSGIDSISVETGSELASISDRAFSGCDVRLVDFSGAKQLKNIGSSCFADCSGLETAVFADGLETVGGKTFYGCNALEFLSFGKSQIEFSEQIFDNFRSVERLEISAWCYNLEAAFGAAKYFIGDNLSIYVTDGTVYDEFVGLFAGFAKKIELASGANISWSRITRFEKLASAIVPISVLNNCDSSALCATDEVIVFGTGKEGLNCSPNIETQKLTLIGISRIEKDAFSTQTLGFIDEVVVDCSSLEYVGENVFGRTNWFVNNNNESIRLGTEFGGEDGPVFVGNFCIAIKDVNSDGSVVVGEGVETICSKSLSGSNLSELILPSTLKCIKDSAFMAKIGTIAFRQNAGVILLEEIGSGALYFGFDSVIVQKLQDGEFVNTSDSLVLGNISYVGNNAFNKNSQYFTAMGDVATFGSTVLVSIAVSEGEHNLSFPDGTRVIASNCFDATDSDIWQIVVPNSVLMIGENNFGTGIRIASFGENLGVVEGTGLFEFNKNSVSELFIFSNKCVKLDLIVKLLNYKSATLWVKEASESYYRSEVLGTNIELKIIEG